MAKRKNYDDFDSLVNDLKSDIESIVISNGGLGEISESFHK